MKVVYHCFGGAHASPTAAAIHLGILPREKRPNFTDMRRIPFFDEMTATNHGKLNYAGKDHSGNEVYFLARRNNGTLITNIIKGFAGLKGEDPSEYYFIDCMQRFNLLMITGGFTSRKLGWVSFGRPIVTLGTIFAYPALVSIVEKTIRRVRDREFT